MLPSRTQLPAIVLLFTINSLISPAAAQDTPHSQLWGTAGEAWSPASRLPDFSYAGYHFGEVPLPVYPVTANVKDFGAQGDGQTDDTEAFKQAIAQTEQGAILIPAGHYVISDILWLKKPNLVLRGEGSNATVLQITTELEDVRPNMGATTSGKATSNYSWSGGFLWLKGQEKSKPLSAIVSESARGGRQFVLESAAGIELGQRVALRMTDDAQKTLLSHLYSEDSGDTDEITRPVSVDMICRVVAVEANRITLDRPARWDVRQAWKPRLTTSQASVTESGIESLAISFPAKPYNGHFSELGMNAIAMNGVSDCWIRDVRISNCDSGVFFSGQHCTMDGLRIDGTRQPMNGDTGHHGVTMGQDCLLENFDIQAKFIHDITMTNLMAGNVVKNGKGSNLSFDHHKRAPYENLFSNIDVGSGSQVWRCGGGAQLGKHSGARETFWGIRAEQELEWPPAKFGPNSMNIIGVTTSSPTNISQDRKWFEAIPPEQLRPVDLHAAQLEKRLKEL
ncbi:MAG TPA: hypothetical protein DCR55_01675 [Lentisphaeria bacterium]|nr:hypothetical protein [Lentisphaeria bacterium]